MSDRYIFPLLFQIRLERGTRPCTPLERPCMKFPLGKNNPLVNLSARSCLTLWHIKVFEKDIDGQENDKSKYWYKYVM